MIDSARCIARVFSARGLPGNSIMTVQQTSISSADLLSRRDAGSGWHAQIPDDKTMLRAARDLTKDIAAHRADIYWPDMVGSALVGYGALAGAILKGANRTFLVPAVLAKVLESGEDAVKLFSALKTYGYGASPMPLPLLRARAKLRHSGWCWMLRPPLSYSIRMPAPVASTSRSC